MKKRNFILKKRTKSVYKYRIPAKYKRLFTKAFIITFVNELQKIQPKSDLFKEEADGPPLICGFIGSCGLHDAFMNSCKKHGYEELYRYYEALPWYDNDIFESDFVYAFVLKAANRGQQILFI